MPIERLAGQPLIYPELDSRIGDNINGPSVIGVPDWVEESLGAYYLYFAHHQGTFIRMAYADDIQGPYTVYSPGVLALSATPFARHIASPDVHVDHAQRKIVMLYHGAGPEQPTELPYRQLTCYAESRNGRLFTSQDTYVGQAYLCIFPWQGYYYGLAGGSERRFSRSTDVRQVFEMGPQLQIEGETFPGIASPQSPDVDRSPMYRMRHVAVHRQGHTLAVYYSNVGDCPERLKMTSIDLRPDWTEWRGSQWVEVLRPEREYEGGRLPLIPSQSGRARAAVRQVRDPEIYEENGDRYLFYSVAGESGIALARMCNISEKTV